MIGCLPMPAPSAGERDFLCMNYCIAGQAKRLLTTCEERRFCSYLVFECALFTRTPAIFGHNDHGSCRSWPQCASLTTNSVVPDS